MKRPLSTSWLLYCISPRLSRVGLSMRVHIVSQARPCFRSVGHLWAVERRRRRPSSPPTLQSGQVTDKSFRAPDALSPTSPGPRISRRRFLDDVSDESALKKVAGVAKPRGGGGRIAEQQRGGRKSGNRVGGPLSHRLLRQVRVLQALGVGGHASVVFVQKKPARLVHSLNSFTDGGMRVQEKKKMAKTKRLCA